jgi:hypothetical protein
LDQVTLDIELVLISIIQGVALTFLAENAAAALGRDGWAAAPYVIAGLLFISIFWSASMVHALSFVGWPIDLGHNLLYFATGLLEVLTFHHMMEPAAWFAWSAGFFAVAEVLYLYDFTLMRGRAAGFQDSAPRRALHGHMVRRQVLEMAVVVPGGVAFNLVATLVVAAHPGAATVLVVLQLALAVGFLAHVLRGFGACVRFLSACADVAGAAGGESSDGA